MNTQSLTVRKSWQMFESGSKVTVKVTRSKFMLSLKRPCQKEHIFQIWKPYLLNWGLFGCLTSHLTIFSSPEPKAQVSYCHSAPSVVRPSVVCPSFRRKLSHFRLLLWNRWTEFNKTWQKARSQRTLPSLCFSSWSEKQDGRPGRWLAETFSTSSLKPLNRIQLNLTGSKISTPSTKFVFFGPIRKIRWPPWPMIGWDIFDFSETTERNSTQLDRKQDLNALYQVCVFRADWKNKMAAPAYDWLRHFRLLLWNRWTEFNKTLQEARSQSPLPSLCFSGRFEKQDGRPGLWLAETFSTFPLKPLNRNQQTLIGSKISKLSTKFVFFGLIGKQDGRPGLWLAETFSTSLKPLNGIQRNLTGNKISMPSTKFVFFGPIGKTRWPPGLWLAETFSTSLKPLNGIQRNLTGIKI